MKFLSVCSGIEAASVAWASLGWKAAAFSEIEPFPCAVLAHHYPDVPNLGDMTKFKDWPDDLPVDLLCGGTPCQSFSVAGLRAGLADPRGNLMLTYLAIASKYRPKWVVWENVPGVLSSWSGDQPPSDLVEGQEWEADETSDFGSFLAGLGELGYGYAYRVLDAQYFGVPQRRRRVFVVGCLGDWRAAAAVLFERHSLSGHPAPRREAGQRAAPTIAARAGSSSGPGIRAEVDGGAGLIAQAFGGNNTAGPIDVATALNACASASGRMDFESETFIAHSLRGEGFDASEDGTGRGTPLVPVAAIAFDCMASGMNGFGVGDMANPMRVGTKGSGSGHQAVAYTPEIAATMVARSSRGGGQTNSPGHQADSELVARGMQVRRLTPRECERLQGFPDDYTAITVRGKPAADGPRYKALGNSWAVPCARWIGQRIQAVDAINALRRAA